MFLTSKTPNVGFNMFYSILMVPLAGPRFIADAHAEDRPVYAWTVNDEETMRWLIEHCVDGVITDDPEKFSEAREAWEKGQRQVNVHLRSWIFIVWVWVLTTIVGQWFKLLHREAEREA